ncbi:MAG: ATP-grasp fold amidoligase family protein [Clostridia bacterium]
MMKKRTRALMYLRFLRSKDAVRWAYQMENGQKLALEEPRTFCEKLNWLKLSPAAPGLRRYVDKLVARDYAAHVLGAEHVPKLLGIWQDAQAIPWDALPDRFYLKCPHGSHCGICVIGNQQAYRRRDADRAQRVKRIGKWLRRNWYWVAREAPYRDIRPRVYAEADLSRGGLSPVDYKVMCFGGEPEIVQVHRKFGRQCTIDLYDKRGCKLDARKRGYPVSQQVHIDAVMLSDLLVAARKLARGVVGPDGRIWPYVRVDLYYVGGRVMFGEMTFFDSAGLRPFEPPAFENLLGGMIPIDSMTCPKCLAPMRYSVAGDARHDCCPKCGLRRTKKIEVGS